MKEKNVELTVNEAKNMVLKYLQVSNTLPQIRISRYFFRYNEYLVMKQNIVKKIFL